jgi:hypothetical protein
MPTFLFVFDSPSIFSLVEFRADPHIYIYKFYTHGKGKPTSNLNRNTLFKYKYIFMYLNTHAHIAFAQRTCFNCVRNQIHISAFSMCTHHLYMHGGVVHNKRKLDLSMDRVRQNKWLYLDQLLLVDRWNDKHVIIVLLYPSENVTSSTVDLKVKFENIKNILRKTTVYDLILHDRIVTYN